MGLTCRLCEGANPATLKFSDGKCYRGLRAQFGVHLPAQKPYLALPVLRAVPPDGCSELTIDPAHSRPLPSEYAVLVERGTCFFMIKACYAQQLEGARAVFVASNDTTYFSMAISNTTDSFPCGLPLTLPSLMISANTTDSMFKLEGDVTMWEAGDMAVGPLMDGSTFFIWLIACVTLFVACWRATESERRKATGRAPPSVQLGEVPEETQALNMYAALGFIVFASGMLVLLFFVIKHIMIVIVVMFCISGCTGLTFFSRMYVHQIHAAFRHSFHINWLDESVSVGTLIVMPCALAIVVSWAIFRFEPWAWILQDFMAFSLCVYFLCVIRLPNVKVLCGTVRYSLVLSRTAPASSSFRLSSNVGFRAPR